MAKAIIEKTKWQRIRKFFNDIHLWLGLSSALIVVAVCFSGTVYVFNTELTEKAAPHLYKVQPVAGQERMHVDSLVEKVKHETDGTIASVTIPAELNRTYQFNVKKKEDSTARGGTTYMVNPYAGTIVGNSKEKNGTKEFMGTMFSLHRWLLLDKVKKPIIKGVENRKLGSMITGWATIIFTLGCITGLIIWFPQKVKHWRQGLKIKWNAGWKRVNHDLHNSLAFYSLIFLLLMGLTGPQWSFEWYRTGLQKILGTYKPKEAPNGKSGGERKESEGKKEAAADTTDLATVQLSIADYVNEADKVLPYKGNYVITLPADADAKTMITKTKLGFFAPAAGDRITMDPKNGKVVKLDVFKKKPFNERVAGSIKAIHVGNVYGTFTKILYFLACLIATSLPITGTMIWLNKMKKKTKTKKEEPIVTLTGDEKVA
ncbi:PepSY-associated TM helix domain-containing protein [Lacibacter sp.]|uniref:PepSY-associated TM helix domain-containing protein n=1 Tax=Lacibacter sp. TaxID=1915409 RepID=UPI002B4AE830|nr:PepSY-associated TM helix domain-containing protein [Lacibacter sp.]HLP37440.1 PepSY-associated TM helix domain-containing protein [Lacibacter sp.]